jgi:Zn-finger protein
MCPLCPNCAQPMVRSELGRKIFECSNCHEIIQLLEVAEVSSTLPWREKYFVEYGGNSSDDPVR